MPVTYKKIANVSLSSANATISITNIPQDYTDLVLQISARASSTGNVWRDCAVRLNGISTSLTGKSLFGNGSSAASGGSGIEQLQIPSNSATANTFGNAEVYIPNYTGSQTKVFSADSVTENNGTTAYQVLQAVQGPTSSAITSIDIVVTATTMMQYSSATLYGIKKS